MASMADESPTVRVYANAGLVGLSALRWNDVASDNPYLAGWLQNGMVSLTDPWGNSAPDEIPQSCCGSVR